MNRELTAIELAVAVYKTADEFLEWAHANGFSDVLFMDDAGVECAIASRGVEHWVAFRGVDNATELLKAFDASMVQTSIGRVHEGWWVALASVAPRLHVRLAQRIMPASRVYVTGHSRGGALALLFAAELAKDVQPLAGVFTFGCPRVGDADFAAWFRTVPVQRYVNNNDVVPRLPPVHLTAWHGYKHVGKLLWFDCCGDLLVEPNRLTVTLDRIAGRIKAIGREGTDGVADHDKTEYSRLVKRNALGQNG